MLLWADGFDHYGTDAASTLNMLAGAWTAFQAGSGATQGQARTTFKRTGTHSLWINGAGHSNLCEARRSVVTTSITVGVGFGIYFGSLPTVGNVAGFSFGKPTYTSPSTGCIATVTINTDGSLNIYKGGADGGDSELLAVTEPLIRAGTFNHIETKLVVDPIVGYLEIRIDGKVKAMIANADFGPTICSQVIIGKRRDASGDDFYIDDIICWDDTGATNNDFMGPQRALTDFVEADTIEADWSITGAASGTAAINETAPDGDTSYLSADVVGDVSEFTLPTLPPETVGIAAVYIPAYAKIVDAGMGHLKVSMISGTDVGVGPELNLTPAYGYHGSVFELDPATAAAWTKAGFEAAKVRIEKVE